MEYKLDFCSPDCFSMRCAVCPGPNGCTRHSDTTRQANILFFLRPHRTHFSKGTKSFLNVVVVLVFSCWLALDLYTHQMLEMELPFSNPFRNRHHINTYVELQIYPEILYIMTQLSCSTSES